MLKFKNYEYVRPDLEKLELELNELIIGFEKSETFEEQSEYFDKINKIKLNIATMSSLSHVRYSINTKDEFYLEENNFYDEKGPVISNILNRFEFIK